MRGSLAGRTSGTAALKADAISTTVGFGACRSGAAETGEKVVDGNVAVLKEL
jgi:hypothetical protein